jgi:hypothetical protein
MTMQKPQRFSSDAGIAIGPILFVIALLAVLAATMAGGGGDFSVASISDRITADVSTQANMIRSTVNDCNLRYMLAVSSGSVDPTTDPYPSSNTSNGTAVSALLCDPLGSVSLWSDKLLPQPTAGFNAWTYIDVAATGGGRCFWTTPQGANPNGSSGIVGGLTHAASKFNSGATYSANQEVLYDPASASQKFIVWVTMPTGTPDSHCLP